MSAYFGHKKTTANGGFSPEVGFGYFLVFTATY
jgi:hypothetical protein